MIQRRAAILVAESAQRLVVLAQQDVGLGTGPELGVVVVSFSLGEPVRVLVQEPGFLDKGVAKFGVDVGVDGARQLHDVAVGVVDGLAFDVCHGACSLDGFCC